MSDYKSFLLKKDGEAVVKDSFAEWGIMVQSIPFLLVPEMKELPSTDWPDEDGDDEYVPSVTHFKAYSMDISFVYIGNYETANEKIRAFWNYVKQGTFQFYDQYTSVGRSGVRYVSFSPKAFRRRNNSGDTVEFSMTFKVNDPVENIILTL